MIETRQQFNQECERERRLARYERFYSTLQRAVLSDPCLTDEDKRLLDPRDELHEVRYTIINLANDLNEYAESAEYGEVA